MASQCTLIQELLATHMGMHVDSMQRFADRSPADRSGVCLPDAHLPKRGFYRTKAVGASQLQKQSESKPAFCILSCLGPETSKASSSSSQSPVLGSKISLDSVVEDVGNLDGDESALADRSTADRSGDFCRVRTGQSPTELVNAGCVASSTI